LTEQTDSVCPNCGKRSWTADPQNQQELPHGKAVYYCNHCGTTVAYHPALHATETHFTIVTFPEKSDAATAD